MLTINRIHQHWESVEVDRLRRQVQEMQAHIQHLQGELRQASRTELSSEQADALLVEMDDWSL